MSNVYKEIEQTLGIIPGFFKAMPVETLEHEWELFKIDVLQPESAIEPKFRELIGVSAAAARQCWYCATFHSALARFHGATEAEIEEALHLSKFGGGWSTFLNGLLYDHTQFNRELDQIITHLTPEK